MLRVTRSSAKNSNSSISTSSKTAGSSVEYVQAKTTHFEFLGPHGSIFTLIGLPLTVLGLFFICDKNACNTELNLDSLLRKFKSSSMVPNHFAFKVYSSWVLLHCILYLVLPGKVVTGTPLPTPNRQTLSYNVNGFFSLVFTATIFINLLQRFGLLPLIWIADNYFQLALSAIWFASGLSLILYFASFRSKKVIVAKGGNSGYPLYDIWIGRELNPRWFSVDLKYVCELRPGLIGWSILNASLAAKQFEELGRLTNSMVFVNVVQGYYVFDALWNENAILTTMDITSDGFGFMLVFGDLVWVPFTYSLQARYLSLYTVDLSFEFLMFCVFVNVLGLYIFRSSNSEKNAFRRDPNSKSVKHLDFLKTSSGSKLLISGWWGMARKINYTGDWLMSVAWCLPCGFDSAIPYFYCIYFAVLLIHRAERDDELCSSKYGKDWNKYKTLVPFKFIPGIW